MIRACSEASHSEANMALWPSTETMPKAAGSAAESMLRTLVVLMCLPAFHDLETHLMYNLLQAANQCPRYLPDLVLGANCSRRMGSMLHTYLFASVYMFSADPARSRPLAPNHQCGWINWMQAARRGVPSIDLSHTVNPDEHLFSGQDLEKFILPEFIVLQFFSAHT